MGEEEVVGSKKMQNSKIQCLHQLFEERALKSPDQQAVVFEGKSLTYFHLNNKANQLAHYLQSLGVGPNDLVGVCLERSLDMIVGVLAVLKAGGAIVPLDTSYPDARLDFILKDTGAKVLLTQSEFESRFSDFDGKKICVDKEKNKFNDQRKHVWM